MAEAIYETPGEKFSQGDIFELLPHSYIEPPLLMLAQEAGSEAILRLSPEPFVSFNDKDGQRIVSMCKRGKGIILSHGCVIDKPQVRRWLVCPVIPLTEIPSGQRGDVKRNRAYSMLYLPQIREVLPESFVYLDQVSTIDAEIVRSAHRLVSLSDIGRKALFAQFIRSLTRWELRTIACPNCQMDINQSEALPVKTP